MRAVALVAAALAGCAGFANKIVPNADAPASSDANPGCNNLLTLYPTMPHSGPAPIRVAFDTTRVTGVPTYMWSVTTNGIAITTTPASPDGSQIDFVAQNPGVYVISAQLTGGAGCTYDMLSVTISAPGANIVDYRLHVVPPAQLAPTQETVIEVDGGGDAYRPVPIDPGIAVAASVTSGGAGVPAYVRFAPVIAPGATVEVFAASDGTFSTRLLGMPYDVLVVPAAAGLAPRHLSWTPGVVTLAVDAGSAVSGVVKDGSGAALAGATVQLSSAGVPSTIATTASNGSFTVRAAFAPGAMVDVAVTPPAGRGLPALDAVAAFDLTQSIQVQYAAGLATTCNLSGTAVTRNATAQPNAQVTVVGALAAVGTVTAGTAVNATGTVRIAASADATGHLPTTIVPRAPLQAVVKLTAGDLAVATFDTTTSCTVAIAAPAQIVANGTVFDSIGNTLAGARVAAVASGALAMAGAPPLQLTTSSTGGFSFSLASGGAYDIRFDDPLGRGAPIAVLGVSPANVPASTNLPKPLHIYGPASVTTDPNPVEGAAIDIDCYGCTGLDAARPIAEGATDSMGNYRIAVPDPGAM